MSETARISEALRIAITCLPLLGVGTACRKPDPEIKAPTDSPTTTTTASTTTTTTNTIPAVVAKKGTCGGKYNAIVGIDDAERLPHSGKPLLGCPSTIDVAAASAMGLAPEFGDLRGIALSEDCTKKVQATDPKSCVYVAKIEYPPEGRPAIEAGEVVFATLQIGATWRRGRSPDVASISDAERRRRADRWTAIALAEHASVASFARAAIELMAVGAPAGLIAAATSAAADEIGHAELAFTIASAYAGIPLDPGPLPALTPRGGGLSELVRSTFVEGCVAETAAAVRAARALAIEEDPAVRDALAIIAEDETRHAELAWQTVSWALRVGGAEARRALDEALQAASRAVSPGGAPNDVWTDVVMPSLALLQ